MRFLVCHPGADWATADVHDGYVSALTALGHEVGVYNLSLRMSRADSWLKYNWRKAGRPDPRPTAGDVVYNASEGILAPALRGQVDWVLVITGAYLHPDALVLLKRAGVRTALLLTESPYEDGHQMGVAPAVDVVFTNERTSVSRLRFVNPNVYYLPPAFDPAKHSPTPPAAEPRVLQHDVVFVGTGFAERLELLAEVDWTGIDLGLYGTYELMGSRSRLRRHLRGGVVNNAVTAALYRRAKVGLNLYRESTKYSKHAPRITGAESMNPRAVELAACGVFTLSGYRREADEVFGDLVPTFGSPKELGELTRYYLAHPEERRERAAALPAKVARSTYAHRAGQLARFLGDCGRELDTRGELAPAHSGG